MGLYVVGELGLPRYTQFIISEYRTPSLAWPSVRNTSQGLTRTGFLFWIPVRRPTWYEIAAVANAKSNRSPSRRQEMVLEGLVGNEEFWTMDLSDDEVPIRDSTPTKASRSIYLC